MSFPVGARTTGELITASIWNADLKDNLNTLRAGGIAIASQAALDFLYASSATQFARLAKGTALQYPRLNAAATAWEFATAGASPAMTLIGEVEGTDATAAATNVATFAISGLTVKDSLRVVIRHSSLVALTSAPVLYNVTDSVTLLSNLGGSLAINTYSAATVDIYPDHTSNTLIVSQGMVAPAIGPSDSGGVLSSQRVTFTTAWTGSWTLALRTGATGVNAGGTYHYRIAVYKVAGQ